MLRKQGFVVSKLYIVAHVGRLDGDLVCGKPPLNGKRSALSPPTMAITLACREGQPSKHPGRGLELTEVDLE